jgi:hypothetical protein
LIELTRNLCKHLRTVIKKLCGSRLADVRLMTGPDGLKVQANSYSGAAEFHRPGTLEVHDLVIPFHLLSDVEGQRSEPVLLLTPKKGVLEARWEDRGVSRSMQYQRPKAQKTAFPCAPELLVQNPPTLLAALREAFETTDPNGTRYALACVQVRGKTGQLGATDGHQLLLQSGLTFGFEDDLLVCGTPVFACKDLHGDQAVYVGRTEEHFVVRAGLWTFALPLQKDGRFPRIEEVIPRHQSAATTLELHPADAQFLLENVRRLPGSAEDPALTLDLGETIAVRAQSSDTPRPTEMVVSNSRRTGDDVTICSDRRYLARAAAMGFRSLHFFGPDAAVLARDEQRQYLWMPIGQQRCVRPDDCLRIESPPAQPASTTRPRPIPQRPIPPTTIPMATNQTADTPAAEPETRSPTQAAPAPRRRRVSKSSGSALDQAIALRDQLRVAQTSTKELIRALKAEKRSQKSLNLALDSLKQLQAVA